MSWLKDLYPCTDCKTLVRVHSRRDIPEAICEPCTRRHWDLSSIRWADELADQEATAGNAQKDEHLLCVHWFKAFEHRMAAQHRALHALKHVDGRKRGRMALRIRSRLTGVRDNLERLSEYVEDVVQEALVLEAIAGDPDAPEVPVVPRPRPCLSVVRSDEP